MAYVGIVGFTDKPWTPCRQGTVRAECSVRLRDRRQYTAVASAVGLQKRLCRPISSSPSRCAHYGVRRGKNEKPQRLSSLRLFALFLLMRPLPPYGANNRRPFLRRYTKAVTEACAEQSSVTYLCALSLCKRFIPKASCVASNLLKAHIIYRCKKACSDRNTPAPVSPFVTTQTFNITKGGRYKMPL